MAKIMRELLLTGATGKPRLIFHHLGFWVQIRAIAWHLVEVNVNTWREQGNVRETARGPQNQRSGIEGSGSTEKSPGTSKIASQLLRATGSLATTRGAMELEEDSG
ncbi:hypothetical protein B0H13DRAFT_1861429 [Mycena leptocephala]|nr:hypothetical protein B0H13DRAFT_1861429 [Mycena leptocephala]